MTLSDRLQELLAWGCFEDQILVEIEAVDPGLFFGMTLVAAERRRLTCFP